MANMIVKQMLVELRAVKVAERGGKPWKEVMAIAKFRAKKKGLAFDLDEEWATDRYTGRCELSGVEFNSTLRNRDPFSLSIDQINPGRGYTKENSRFILLALNYMLGSSGDVNAALYIAREFLRYQGVLKRKKLVTDVC